MLWSVYLQPSDVQTSIPHKYVSAVQGLYTILCVQKQHVDLNPLAVCIPSNKHYFNLVSVHAAHVNVQVLTLFGSVEHIFGYYLCSDNWWSVLKSFISITARHRSDNRWSPKAAAVNTILDRLENVIAALEQLHDTPTKMLDILEDAAVILNGIEKIEFAAFLFL
jgi:hypothetical protein